MTLTRWQRNKYLIEWKKTIGNSYHAGHCHCCPLSFRFMSKLVGVEVENWNCSLRFSFLTNEEHIKDPLSCFKRMEIIKKLFPKLKLLDNE